MVCNKLTLTRNFEQIQFGFLFSQILSQKEQGSFSLFFFFLLLRIIKLFSRRRFRSYFRNRKETTINYPEKTLYWHFLTDDTVTRPLDDVALTQLSSEVGIVHELSYCTTIYFHSLFFLFLLPIF